VFRILSMIMRVAPVGAFGAIAAVVGAAGRKALASLGEIMAGFSATCLIFVLVILGPLLRAVARISIFSLLRYLAREFLLIVSTSSSESALPRLIAKMEHLGVSRAVVGFTVPTGYSFNLDGIAIYLTMASLFVANALGEPLSIGQQVSLLLFMIIPAKGAAGVTGAGVATPHRRPAVAPPRTRRRGGADRRHRPVHVGGPRADRLRGQRRRHGTDRNVGRRVRPGAGRPGTERRGPVRRADDARRGSAPAGEGSRQRGPGRTAGGAATVTDPQDPSPPSLDPAHPSRRRGGKPAR
jgi:hypothetical protein